MGSGFNFEFRYEVEDGAGVVCGMSVMWGKAEAEVGEDGFGSCEVVADISAGRRRIWRSFIACVFVSIRVDMVDMSMLVDRSRVLEVL